MKLKLTLAENDDKVSSIETYEVEDVSNITKEDLWDYWCIVLERLNTHREYFLENTTHTSFHSKLKPKEQ